MCLAPRLDLNERNILLSSFQMDQRRLGSKKLCQIISFKACRPSGQMSSMGYLAFAVSVINSVVNAANNINNNDNNNNNNNNDNNNNNNNVNIQNSNNNQNNMNMLIAGRKLPVERLLELQERLARHHQVKKDRRLATGRWGLRSYSIHHSI